MTTKSNMHPFLKYPGGKTKEIDLVLKYKPETIDKYIEPFVGGGSIYFAMDTENSYINDKSSDLIQLYTLLKEQNKELKNYLLKFDKIWKDLSSKQIDEIKLSIEEFSLDELKTFYETARKRKNKTIENFEKTGQNISGVDIEKIEITARKTAFYMLIRKTYNDKIINNVLHIACFYFLREYCYSSMFRFSSKGDFNVPYGGMSYNEKYMKNKLNYMFSSEMKDYLSKTIIENKDFEDFLNSIDINENDFIFLDPPYDSDFSTYDNNPFDKNEQIRLRDYLSKTKASWMLIIKKTNFIFELYKNFNIYEYNMNYMVSFKNRNDKDVKHLLITNYKLKEI